MNQWFIYQDYGKKYLAKNQPRHARHVLPGGIHYKETILTIPGETKYQHDVHWGYLSNPLVHYRSDSRESSKLGKVLFVEEIQSDWHQEGRKKGYKKKANLPKDFRERLVRLGEIYIDRNKALNKTVDILKEEYPEIPTIDFIVKNSDHHEYLKGFVSDKAYDIITKFYELDKKHKDLDNELSEFQRLSNEGVDDAPFKDSKSWSLLAFKYILKQAIDEGKDSIAWTTGEQQADRYNLSQHVNEIKWSKDNGKKLIRLDPRSGAIIRFSIDEKGIVGKDPMSSFSPPYFVGKNISDVIGKELSEKIMDSDNGNIEGAGLKLGGTGMKGFYDSILPVTINKYIKKWGGKVSKQFVNKDVGEVWAMEITPQMRQSIKHGQPLFKSKQQTLPDIKNATNKKPFDTNGQQIVDDTDVEETIKLDKDSDEILSKIKSIATTQDMGIDSLRFIDLSGSMIYVNNPKYTHAMINHLINPDGNHNDIINKHGFVRFRYYNNEINIEIGKNPNKKQLKSIGKFIEGFNGKIMLDLFDGKRSGNMKIYEDIEDNQRSRKFIDTLQDDIRKFYEDNIPVTEDTARKYSLFKTKSAQPSNNALQLDLEGKTTTERAKNKATRYLVDKLNSLKMAQDQIYDQTGKLIYDVYRDARLFMGSAPAKIQKFGDYLIGGKDSFLKRLAKAGFDIDQIGQYMMAQHVEEREKWIQSKNKNFTNRFEDLSGGAGMTLKDAKEIIKQYKDTELNDFADEAQGFIRSALKMRLSSGLISQEHYDNCVKRFKYYVPLKGKDEIDEMIKSGRGMSVTRSEFARTQGRESMAHNPFVQAALDYEESVLRSEKNKVLQKLMSLMLDNPSPKVWEVKKQQYKPVYDDTGAIKYLEPTDRFLRENEAWVKVEGKPIKLIFHDTGLAEGLVNLGAEKTWKFLHTINSWLRAVNTFFNPQFIITNFMRDYQTAMIHLVGENDSKELAINVSKNIGKAMRGIYSSLRENDKVTADIKEYQEKFRELKDIGGVTGFFDYKTFQEKMKSLQGELDSFLIRQQGRKVENYKDAYDYLKAYLKPAEKFISDLNQSVEVGVRLATYVELLKMGMDKKQAALYAKELTVDFNMKGTEAHIFDGLYLFFSAGLGGSARLAKAFWSSKKVQKICGGIALSSLLLAQYNRWILGDDDWDDITEFAKDNNWLFAIPGTKKLLSIKVPYGYNIFNAMGSIIDSAVHGEANMGDSFARMFKAVNDAFNPLGSGSWAQVISPTILDPVVQIYGNKNFMGSPIYKEQPYFQANKPQHELYFDGVNFISKAGTKVLWDVSYGAIDLNPEIIDHLVNTVGGGLFTTIETGLGSALKVATGSVPSIKEVPFVNKFLKEPSNSTRKQAIYNMLRESRVNIYTDKEIERWENKIDASIDKGIMEFKDAKRLRQEMRKNQREASENKPAGLF